jgi:hypothetical protein
MKLAQNSPFLRLICSVFYFVMFLSACEKVTINNQILTSFRQNGLKIDKNTEGVFILDDEGCLACNRIFSQTISNLLDNDNIKFVIAANGNKVDISLFLEKKNSSNVLMDRNKTILTSSKLEHSTIVFLHNNQIDTVITINAQDLENQMGIVKNRFNLVN